MRVQLESTQDITDDFGVPCRLWKGTTEKGADCLFFVHRIMVAREADTEQFEAELLEMPPPLAAVPLRLLLP